MTRRKGWLSLCWFSTVYVIKGEERRLEDIPKRYPKKGKKSQEEASPCAQP